jgi:hydrogenase maturation protein HypF
MAVMVRSLEEARSISHVDAAEAEALTGPMHPIVLLRTKGIEVADSVASGSDSIGLMLPYSPLHHLLLQSVGAPVVATSGNLSDEPICTDEKEALERFAGIADLLLVHDRPILRAVDDSVVRVMPQGVMAIRRARGLAPMSISVPGMPRDLVAVGGHMKSVVAVTLPNAVVVGQHVGDLDNLATRIRMEEEIKDLEGLYGLKPSVVVHDSHPDYASTQVARTMGIDAIDVQHHLAHALACAAENNLSETFLAVVWDGTGLGTDKTIWGGEFIALRGTCAERVANLRPFLLPGGEIAARQGWRAAFGALFEAMGEQGLLVATERLRSAHPNVAAMLRSGTRCVATTSAGRLFDAAAALGAGIDISRFEGDAAMQFEAIARNSASEPYPFAIRRTERSLELDWGPMICAICDSFEAPAEKSFRFHASLASGIAQIADLVGIRSVALSGGCFQNKLLTELTWKALTDAGFRPYGHQRIPPNDGGLAFGQAVAAARKVEYTFPAGGPSCA